MSKIIDETNNENIKKLSTEATIDFFKTMAIDILTLPGLNAFSTGVDSPSLNVVIDTRYNEKINEKIVQQISHFFEKYSQWVGLSQMRINQMI